MSKTLRKDTFIEKTTTSKDNFDPNSRKVSKDSVDPKRRKVSKDNVDPNWRKFTTNKFDPKRRKVPNDDADSKGRKVYKNIVDSKYRKTRLKSKKNPSVVVNRASKSNGHPLTNETTGTCNFQRKRTCLTCQTPSNSCQSQIYHKKVKAVAVRILEHVFKHYDVNCQEASTVQAFEIYVCWLAASLLKHGIDMKDSLALAKLYLNFDCKKEEGTDVYSELWKHVKEF
ncbi:hypothetical protein JHK87_053900 [Glycine soja]|nr:hypothetical protein JHK87_053900 [Glycine soja]